MMHSPRNEQAEDLRVLVLAPDGKDGEISERILARAGIVCVRCPDLEAFCWELEAGAGALIVAEDVLTPDAGFACLAKKLQDQPAWSDVPVILLAQTQSGSRVTMRAIEELGNVTLLERPVHQMTLVSSVRSALRARQRQYQLCARLAQLAEANEQLAEADRRKDEFLAMLAHELRNPLAPIRNAMQVIQLIGPHEPALQRQREVIDRQVTHMVRLVDDLLDVSRISRGKIELKKEWVDLREVVTRAIETVQPLIASRRHHFEVCLPAGAVLAEADPVRLAQIVANLLHNAAKYTDEGGRLWLAMDHDGHTASIMVHDSGAGIAADVLPHIFDLFAQSERSLDRAQGGLGIGLYLVRRLVEMHGGSVHAWSAGLGQGSLFIVRLPLPSASGNEGGADGLSAMLPGLPGIADIRQRILVVDDNIDAANSLAELIELWGHEVRTLHDGAAAEQAALAYHPDMTLLDIGLPGLNGYEVARRLRRQPALAGMLLVAMTGYGQDEDRRLAREAGFDRHFTKPVNLDDLKALLNLTGAARIGN